MVGGWLRVLDFLEHNALNAVEDGGNVFRKLLVDVVVASLGTE